jgi:hypothetical protein
MSMPLRVRFEWPLGDFTPEIAVRPWARRGPTAGGARDSATGIPASYVVRRDRNLALTLRLEEYEWESYEELLVWLQGSESVTVYLDYPENMTGVDCYLVSPRAGQDVTYNRSQEEGHILEPAIELRRIDGQVWTQEYFAIPVTP